MMKVLFYWALASTTKRGTRLCVIRGGAICAPQCQQIFPRQHRRLGASCRRLVHDHVGDDKCRGTCYLATAIGLKSGHFRSLCITTSGRSPKRSLPAVTLTLHTRNAKNIYAHHVSAASNDSSKFTCNVAKSVAQLPQIAAVATAVEGLIDCMMLNSKTTTHSLAEPTAQHLRHRKRPIRCASSPQREHGDKQ
jgi:hypothetical protein